jgi:hypothetical protein
VALPAQVEPHLEGTEPGDEPLLARGPDQLDDLSIADRTL